ncbi:unnamed protein product [Hermetia illucens]|uniref:Large ribosomal subunit protein mL38 n=1 Tax=Hermetia illucens TaxID=343691 RepID=A0A7R8UFR3_HERIL|nr:39S ribosomal protein L38, mitochondrial [Hermetia illucens]CAD7080015.1 unnamed protein product [Hermetia illucens]
MLSIPINKFGRDFILKNQIPAIIQARLGHTLRGKAPGVARSIEQRLRDDNPVDEEVVKPVNIGFPKLRAPRSVELKERIKLEKQKRQNVELEKKATSNTLQIDLDQVRADSLKSNRQHQLVDLIHHFGIYKDLFGAAYFVPRVPLDIQFTISEDKALPVYFGNLISPTEASKPPKVQFDASTDIITGQKTNEQSFWTLIATNPDGHFSGEEKEYIHWFISNIPNGEVEKGEVIAPYIQPFPPKGLGYQRFIFILYKQNKKLDFTSYKVEKLNDLTKRTFSTHDFYKKYEADITPAGLAFFQSTWDKNITEFYHKVLGMKEPSYEYDFPKPFLRDPEWFPLRQPFNLYLDKHRDQKEVNKDYLKKVLATTHPFKGPEPPLKFPNAHPIRGVPSWLKTEIKKDRLKIGRINDY